MIQKGTQKAAITSTLSIQPMSKFSTKVKQGKGSTSKQLHGGGRGLRFYAIWLVCWIDPGVEIADKLRHQFICTHISYGLKC